MIYHVLNGDALSEKFPLGQLRGKMIIIREVFMEGPVSMNFHEEFWNERASFISEAYDADGIHYRKKVMEEIFRLKQVNNEDDVYLWVEDDLFCQCNMWFAVQYLLNTSNPKIYRVFPEDDPLSWKGYGMDGEQELIRHFQRAMLLDEEDLNHVQALWKAYVENDNHRLIELSKKSCNAIRHQQEVIRAHVERAPNSTKMGRPHQTIMELAQEQNNSFYSLFEKFVQKEGIYGFGDTQVKRMMEELGLQPVI